MTERGRALGEGGAVPQLLFSARERDPHLAGLVRQISRGLIEGGRHEAAGWLLLALVAPELVRGGELAAPARALAHDAAEQLAAGRQVVASAETFLAIGERGSAVALLQRFHEEALLERIRTFDEPLPRLAAMGLGGRPFISDAERLREEAARALRPLPSVVEPERLLPLMEQLGLHAPLAELAGSLGRQDLAAQAWMRAGRRVEAARAFAASGEWESALQALVRIGPDEPEHRMACVVAARLAARLDRVDYDLFHMVGPFMATRATNRGEAEAMKALSELFQRHGQPGLVEAVARRPVAGPGADLGWEDEGLPPLLEEDEEMALDPLSVSLSATSAATLPRPQGRSEPSVDPAHILGFTRDSRPLAQDRSANLREDDLLGLVLGGRYSIERRLGAGGSGVVYEALDLVLGEPVALKFLLGAAHDPIAIERFRREIRLARRLSHPNIVRVYDLGEERGTVYLSMELLHGLSLRALPRAALSPRRVADIVAQAAEALGAAHQQEVVHRDIKPENLFLTDEGRVKLMDFGIARASDLPDGPEPEVVFGTPTYMAPEQVRGAASCVPASDQYALGIVAYELLTGQPPFQHPEVKGLLRMHAEQAPAPASSREPALSAEVDPVLARALAKRPADRFPSCPDFARALARALGA